MKSIFEKKYIAEKQAVAAADKAGLAEGSFEIRKEGKAFQVFEIMHAEMPAAPAGKRQVTEALILALQARIAAAADHAELTAIDSEVEAHYEKGTIEAAVCSALVRLISERSDALETPEADEADEATDSPSDQEWAEMLAKGDQQATKDQITEAPKGGKEWIRASTVVKPTKMVWHVADEMIAAAIDAGKPLPSRKEVQDECVRRGIASGTARTQYQAWKKANDNATANQAAADAASARFNQK